VDERPWLVLGGSGLIGWNCVRQLRRGGAEVVATSLAQRAGFLQLDLRDTPSVQGLIHELDPGVVIVTAAATWADRAELEPAWAMEMNASSVERLRDGLEADTTLVYLSSDCVFDGADGPYSEDAPTVPVNHYGITKVQGERIVAEHPDHVIVRTTVVYGAELRRPGKNSLCQVRAALEAGTPFPAPVDEIGTPTYAGDLADAIVDLVRLGHRGVFHLCGPDVMSRYRYARLAARTFGLDPALVVPVRSEELHRPAKRPRNSGLLSGKAEAALGRQLLGVQKGLEAAKESWFEASNPLPTADALPVGENG
jgi:dTDP-4-dehydrorhamnose reductase